MTGMMRVPGQRPGIWLADRAHARGAGRCTIVAAWGILRLGSCKPHILTVGDAERRTYLLPVSQW